MLHDVHECTRLCDIKQCDLSIQSKCDAYGENGRNPCTGNSRHIHIRYFFMKDRIEKVEMKAEYCPTHLMLADFFTKLLVGEMFRNLMSVIMGYTSIFELDPTLIQSTKELVGI